MRKSLFILTLLMAGLALAQDFEVTGISVCKNVQDRACVEPSETFTADTPSVFCLTFISAPKEGKITHRWSLDGKVMLEVPLTIKTATKTYRLWSEKNLHGQKGNWKVEVVAEDGKVLKEVSFKVE
jgi:hypothetical protein